jgi:hypothetical protein
MLNNILYKLINHKQLLFTLIISQGKMDLWHYHVFYQPSAYAYPNRFKTNA